MHSQFFSLISQNPDYVQIFSNDIINLFHFSVRKSMLENSS